MYYFSEFEGWVEIEEGKVKCKCEEVYKVNIKKLAGKTKFLQCDNCDYYIMLKG